MPRSVPALPPDPHAVTSVIHEFHLSITPVARQQDNYLIRTEYTGTSVPLAETQVQWPVDEWLEAASCLNYDSMENLLAGGSFAPGDDSKMTPIALGKALYQALFQDAIRDSWLAARAVAFHCQQQLRLRLWLKDSRLQRLPWELLYGEDRSLATGTDITLARFSRASGVSDLAAMPPLPDGHQPLRVLMVIASPQDEERLTLRQEVQDLRTSLGRSGAEQGEATLPMELTILEQPGRSDLVQALEQGQFQVLHYAGHSDVSENGGQLYLVNRESGLKELLSGDDLAGLLVNNGIRLTVFNSCRGAYLPEDTGAIDWQGQNLVQALVSRGVPGVIGMAERIPDDVAINFTQLLYRNLHKRHPIDVSLSRTRQGLMTTFGANEPFWVLPILYLRPDFDGYLHQSQYRQVNPLQAILQDRQADPQTALDPAMALAVEVLDPANLPPAEDDALAELIAQMEAEPASPEIEPGQDPAPDATSAPATEDDFPAMVQRLSAPASGEVAPPGEDLRPQWEDSRPFPQGIPPRPEEETAAQVTGNPPSTVSGQSLERSPRQTAESTKPPQWTSRSGQWPWLGIGAGAGGVVALVLGAGLWLGPMTTNGPQNDPLNLSNPSEVVDGQTVPALVDAGLAAAENDDLAEVSAALETLLDQNQLAAANEVWTTLGTDQQISADLAFVKGRLYWQGVDSTDIDEVARAWQAAVGIDYEEDLVGGVDYLDGLKQALEEIDSTDNLEALVALGFSQYALYKLYETNSADYLSAAVFVWEKAVEIDRSQGIAQGLKDDTVLANPLTAHALAGLVMAHTKQAEQNFDAKAYWLDLAARRRDRLENLVPAIPNPLTDPRQVCTHWLWRQDNVRRDWLILLDPESAIACPPSQN